MVTRRSGGLPRSINILSDTALIYGFATGVDLIAAALVDEELEQKKTIGIFGR